ncbi:MAG: signal peptidase I [Candidatus Saccharibacteria bacterium]|nr:signal peptidase I [Candidatus Saccharibacteria bacterium]
MRIKRNERLVYILEAIFGIAILIFALFLFTFSPSAKGYYLAIVLGVLAIVACCLLGYHRDKNYLKSYVSRIVISCIMLIAIVCYMLGLLLGFTRSSFTLEVGQIFGIVLPIILISVATEVFRYVVFHSYFRHLAHVVIFTTITIVMSILFTLNPTSFVSAEATFITICTAFLPIIATEALCSYLSYRIGLQPALIYKLVARLYVYVLPILPNLGHFVYAVVALVLPTMVFLFTYNLNLTNRKKQKRIRHRNRIILTAPIVASLLIIVSLVAGLFKHQIIAVASDSMIPTFARGDALIIEKCDASVIKEGDILVFKHEGIIVTHRVIEIKQEDGHYQFTTQGDNHDQPDAFPSNESHVIGRVVIINKYIGFPTVWLSELFKGSK